MVPQIFTRGRGPAAASAHEIDSAHYRVPIGYVFVRIVTKLLTYRIYKAVLQPI
jgi:hypothetical protein